MRVMVRYFASLREEKSLDEESIQITPPIKVGELFVQIFQRSPVGIRFAVNQCYVSSEHLLEAGDEIAFLPPLGGG